MPTTKSLILPAALAVLLCAAAPEARATPIISEIMASNSTTIADQDGDYSDWLELYNPASTPADLTGWYLTNKASKPTKWQIPAVTLPAGGFLVVFCSEKNDTDPTQPLGTNFNLSASGGYVALVEADGKTIASAYTYPAQFTDVSYGVSQPTGSAELPQDGFFKTATPGAANGDHTNILLADAATIAAPAGIFTASINVSLGGASASEHIRYVLAPSSSSGVNIPAPTASSPEYTGPIAVNASALLEAAVFSSDDSQRGLVAKAMYVKLDNTSANRLDNFSSKLPLVVFEDNGFGLLPNDDNYYPGWIGAFSLRGGKATLLQAPDFFTPDTFKLHGATSAGFLKQSYDVDLADTLGDDLDEPLLGMDDEKSWDSIGPWQFDPTFIHNAVVYSLFSSMGHWAPQTRLAEMFIHNAGGDLDYTAYSGLTLMVDRLKVSSDRININSINPDDVTAPAVTGGYILRVDHPETDLFSFGTPGGTTVMIDTPKLDVLTPPQSAYISSYVLQMEGAMFADQSSGFATHTYLNYIDLPSWIDYHILNVFVENVDAFAFSEYFTKDLNGVIVAGPVWDYDRSMDSEDGRDVDPQVWSPPGQTGYWEISWWGVIARDPDFMQA